jgi:Domain of unknown function (DUF4383)
MSADRLRQWTPAQIAAAIFGLFWALDGISALTSAGAGVSSLGVHEEVSLFGIPIAVNGWHGVFHLLTGLGGIAVCASPGASRTYALAVGPLYLVAALWGLLLGSSAFGLVDVDVFGSLVHAVEGTLMLSAGLLAASATRAAVK